MSTRWQAGAVDLHGRYLRLAPVPPLQFDIRLNGDPVGYPVQPAAQGVAGADRTGLSGQDKERGLERVFDVVLVPQDGAAGGRDHRPVTRHQGGEGRPVIGRRIPGQELTIGKADGRAAVEEFDAGAARLSPMPGRLP